jgi:hypothetical protein
MWRVFGDLLRTRGPAGAFVVLIPSLVWLTIMLLPFWLPGGTWIADQAGLILGAGLVLGAAGVRAWVVETRRWRQEQSRNPIHRWPPLPAHDRSFIRTRLQRRCTAAWRSGIGISWARAAQTGSFSSHHA